MQRFSMIPVVILAVAVWLPSSAEAQGFTHADSGWVPIFNGKNFDGLYSRMYNGPVSTTIDPTFKVDNGTIKVAVGGGHIGTQKKYSHYHVHVEYRFDRDNPSDNAGLTYHTDESVARMGGTSLTTGKWPRSIECQMKQSETGSAFSIQQLTFTTRVTAKTSFAPYKADGVEVDVCASGCDGRNFKGSPLIEGGAHWQSMDVIARGADSARHIINDTTVFRLWNIRIFKASDAPDGPRGNGTICLQAEGAGLAYRNWEIMELRPGGPDYQTRFFVTAPNQGESLAAGSTYKIAWKTLGKVAKVNLEYSTGGAWKSVADSAANTGSYDWKVPAEVTDKLRVRISGPAWAFEDSSDGMNAITSSSSVQRMSRALEGDGAGLDVEGVGVVLSALQGFSSVEITDVSGKLVRVLPLDGNRALWDKRDGLGAEVRPGLYFFRARGPLGQRSAEALIP
jgi:hypothetical protein